MRFIENNMDLFLDDTSDFNINLLIKYIMEKRALSETSAICWSEIALKRHSKKAKTTLIFAHEKFSPTLDQQNSGEI